MTETATQQRWSPQSHVEMEHNIEEDYDDSKSEEYTSEDDDPSQSESESDVEELELKKKY